MFTNAALCFWEWIASFWKLWIITFITGKDADNHQGEPADVAKGEIDADPPRMDSDAARCVCNGARSPPSHTDASAEKETIAISVV